jgi:hypothetical protein
MFEIKWIWSNWKTWEVIDETYKHGGGIRGVYLGCLVIAYHYLGEEP